MDESRRPRFSQTSLYRRCSEIETGDPPAGRRRFKDVPDDAYARQKIAKLENDLTNLVTTYELSVLARAFGLPSGFFSDRFESFEAINQAYLLAKTRPSKLDEFPRVYDSDPIPQSRMRLSRSVADRLLASRTNRFVVLIEGPTSVGKSFFVGHLYRSVLRANFAQLVYLNCAKLTVDQIKPELQRQGFLVNDKSPKRIARAAAKHDMVVLDGLRYDQFREGPRMLGAAPGRRLSVSDLMAVVAGLTGRDSPTSVILVMENNGEAIADGRFVDQLPSDVSFIREQIGPLVREEAISFLRSVGADKLSDHLAGQIAEYFYGMPMALSVVAEEIRQLSAIQVERYIDDLKRGSDSGESAVARSGNFILKYLNRLEETEELTPSARYEASYVHPHAFLRLLALMPGPVSKVHLMELVRETAIKRIGRSADLQNAVKALPFVVETEQSYDLHGLVRGFLSSEIDRIVAIGGYDENTSRDELERISWRSALLSWRMIKRASATDGITIEAVDAFVHHVTRLIMLLPSNRRQKKKQTPLSDEIIGRFEARHDSLNDYHLWSIAYERAARPFLLDRAFQATRLHGQYHAKARILERLIDSVERGIPLADIPLAELYKETALCWMHTGRLLSAEELSYRGLAVLRRLEPNFTKFTQAIGTGADSATSERWRQLCDAKSIESIIKLRQGRQVDDIRTLLEPFAMAATRIATGSPRDSIGGRTFAPSLESGAVRILSRSAELEMHAGDLDTALSQFELADALQRAIRGRSLDGEAARKLAVALMRGAAADMAKLRRARGIVVENLQSMEEFAAKRGGRVSNDIIPFLTMEVAVLRCEGNLDVAREKLAQLLNHPYVTRNECTFIASLELQLERFRLAIRSDTLEDESRAKLRRLVDECERSHHFILANEFRLLQAEVAGSGLREEMILEAKRFYQTTGHRLRLADCDMLDSGHSAVKAIGI